MEATKFTIIDLSSAAACSLSNGETAAAVFVCL